MAQAEGDDSPWVRRLRPGARSTTERSRRLICFPHAGGAATAFAPLARVLGEAGSTARPGAHPGEVGEVGAAGPPGAIEVVGFQYPGRQERLSEPAIDSIDGLVQAIVPELAPLLDRPFAFFGHSMGAIVAYEVARVLEHDQGVMPLALFASARRAPSTRRDEHVHRGGDRSLLREVARLGGTPRQLLDDEEVQQMILPALRGDYKAIETYEWQPGPELSCPVWAGVGAADPLTTEAEAARWTAHTTGPFTLRVFPGGHFYLATDAAIAQVAEVVATALR